MGEANPPCGQEGILTFLYIVFGQFRFFLTVHVLLQLKYTKNILIRTFMLPIVTILWDMNIFQNLEKAGDFFFFFNPFQEIGTIKITRNTIMVKSWGKAAGSRASFKLGSKAVSVASQLEVVM